MGTGREWGKFAVGLAVGGLGLAVAGWLFNLMFRSRRFIKYMEERALAEVEERQRESIRKLRQAFVRAKYEEGAEASAERALGQLEDLEAKYRAFLLLLGQKFSPTELAYGRYHTAVDQAYGAVLANLRRLAPLLAHLGTMERSPLLDQQRESVHTLIDDNDRALTAIDRVVAALGAVETSREGGVPSRELATLIGELEELAARAHKYSS